MASVWNQNPVQPWSNYNPYPNNPPIIPPVAADPKIANLQFQAQQWQQQKQFEEWMASQSKSTVDPEMEKKIKENEDELQIIQKEEEEFDKQYSDWEKQFDQWKEQNKNHPNKEQFKQYEEQWNTWKQQMNTKRQEISDKKTAILTTLNNLRVEQSKASAAAAATMSTMMVPPPPIVPPSLQPPQMPFPGQQQTPFPVTPQYGGYPGGTPAATAGQMMIPPPGHNGPQPLAAPPPMFPPGGFQAPAPISSSFSSSGFGTMITNTTTAVSYGNFGGNSYPNNSFQQGGGGGMYGAPPMGMAPFPSGPMGNPPNFGPTNQQMQLVPNSMNPPPPFYPGGGQMGIGGQSFPSPMQRGGGGVGPPQPSYQSSAQNSLQSQSSSIDSNHYHFNKGSDKSASLPPLPNMAPWGSNNTNPFPLASHTMFNNNNNNNNASFGPPPTSYNQQDMQANSGRNNMAPPSSSSFSKGGWDQGRGEQRNQDQYSSSNNGGWKLDSRDFNDDSNNNYKPNSWNQQLHQSDAGRSNSSSRNNASTQPFPKPGQAFSYNPNPIMTPPHNGPPPSSANTNKRAYDDDKSNNPNNNTKKRSGQSRWESSNTPSKPNNMNVQNMNNQQFGNKGENSNNDLKHSIIGDTNNNLNQNMNENKGENQQHGMMTSFNGPPPAQASGGPPMDPNLPLAAVRMMFMLRMRGLLAQATNAAAGGGGTGPLKGGEPLRGPPPRGLPPPMMNRFARHPPPPLMPHSSGPPGAGGGMRRPMMRPPPPRMATPFGARPRHPYMHKGPMARGGFHGPRHHRGGGRMNGFGGVGRNNNEINSQNSNNNYERGNNPFYSGSNENNSAPMATGPSAATQDNNEYYEGNTDYSCNEIDQNSFNNNHEYEHGSYPLDNDNYEDFTPHLKDDIRHYDQDFYYNHQSDQYSIENANDESYHHSTPNFEVHDVINVLSTEPKLFIVLRGLSGSGKSHVSKIIKEIAISLNKDAPKIYSIDDYFMDENNTYAYEPELESTYEASLEKTISKALLSNMNKIIIMDSINAKLQCYEPLIALASRIGYKAYVCEMDNEDVSKCYEQNIHSKTYEEIQRSSDEWEIAPYHYPRLDVLSILNYKKNVDKLSTTPKTKSPSSCKPVEPVGMKDQVSNDSSSCSFTSSRWDNIEKETNLDKLDGMCMKKRSSATNSIEDYLKEPDMLEEIKHCDSNSNKKRVRWADIEEAKEQAKHRALGFVVGMTDWNKMVDDQQPHKALNKTKFI